MLTDDDLEAIRDIVREELRAARRRITDAGRKRESIGHADNERTFESVAGGHQADIEEFNRIANREAHKAKNDEARQILQFLNRATNRNYQPVDANLKMIKARLAEATPEQIKAVIASKWEQWSADEKMAGYLRPATLFNATKFAQYLGELKETV